MQNVNTVVITGNLTRDPESKQSSGGMTICNMRVAVNGRRKNSSTGNWEDEPNYFDVTVFGKNAENCVKYLAKGRGIAVEGRLHWREWDHEGGKRQAVDIIANNVQFLGDGKGDSGGSQTQAVSPDVPIDTGDFERAPVATQPEDDIPF